MGWDENRLGKLYVDVRKVGMFQRGFALRVDNSGYL